MNEVQIFQNDEFGKIRAFDKNGEPWFVGKDVAKILGYKNTNAAIIQHVDEEDRMVEPVFNPPSQNARGYEIPTTIINESGLYSLILSSKLPTAKKFKRWVTSEVLPAIRKTGKYELLPSPDVMADDEFLDVTKLEMDQRIRIAGIIASCRRERLPLVAKVLSLDLDDLKIPSLTSEANSAAIEYIDSAWDSFDTTIPIRVFHANYVNWCKENDIVPMTKNKLTAVLKKFYPIVTSMSSYSVNGKMVYRNVRVYRKTRKQLREGDAR